MLSGWSFWDTPMYNAADVPVDDWRSIFGAGRFPLIAAGFLRSAWATRAGWIHNRRTWHITAGVAYLRTSDYFLNPEHPPLVKLSRARLCRKASFNLLSRASCTTRQMSASSSRRQCMSHNNADFIQSRVRRQCILPTVCFCCSLPWHIPRFGERWPSVLSLCTDRPDLAAHGRW